MKKVLASILISAFLVTMLLTAMTETVRQRHPAQGRVIIGKSRLETIVIANDMELKKAKGSFKYKSENEEDAQQGWILAGEVPTAHESFDTISQFRIQGEEPGTPYALDHTFYKDGNGVKGRQSNRLKQKFMYYTTRDTHSEHHTYPSYGFFKAAIKDGKLQYMYRIKKANEGDTLIGMEEYQDLHEGMQDQKPYKESGVPFACALGVDGDTHGYEGSIDFKATKAKGKGKVN